MVDTDLKKKEIVSLFSENEDYLLSSEKAVGLKKAIEKIELPNTKSEEWKDTDIKSSSRWYDSTERTRR